MAASAKLVDIFCGGEEPLGFHFVVFVGHVSFAFPVTIDAANLLAVVRAEGKFVGTIDVTRVASGERIPGRRLGVGQASCLSVVYAGRTA